MSIKLKLPGTLCYHFKIERVYEFDGNTVGEIINQLPFEVVRKIIEKPNIFKIYINEENYDCDGEIVNFNSKVVDGDILEIPMHIGGPGCC